MVLSLWREILVLSISIHSFTSVTLLRVLNLFSLRSAVSVVRTMTEVENVAPVEEVSEPEAKRQKVETLAGSVSFHCEILSST